MLKLLDIMIFSIIQLKIQLTYYFRFNKIGHSLKSNYIRFTEH